MSSKLRMETRSQTLIRHTRDMLHETSESEGSFTLRLVEEYDRLLPRHKQAFRFRDTGQLDKDLAANTQRVRRWIAEQAIQSDGRLCVDLEEAWVAALREPYRARARKDLVLRHGSLFARIPDSGDADYCECVGELLTSTAAATRTLGQMLANGQLGPEDRALAPGMLAEIRTLQGVLAGLERAINDKVLGEYPEVRS